MEKKAPSKKKKMMKKKSNYAENDSDDEYEADDQRILSPSPDKAKKMTKSSSKPSVISSNIIPAPPPLLPFENAMKSSKSIARVETSLVESEAAINQKRIPTEDELINAKSKLKSVVNRDKRKVTLDRQRLFDSLKSDDCYPLEKLKDIFTVNDASVEHIDLTGVEQLTDAFFAMVHRLHKGSLFAANVTKLTLQGCANITDVSVQFIVKTFTRLETVIYFILLNVFYTISLAGCRLLSEKSLMLLLNEYKTLKALSMRCADVGAVIIPNPDGQCYISVEGCPLVSPPACLYNANVNALHPKNTYFAELVEMPPWKVYKVLIVNCLSLGYSVLGSLVTGKLSKANIDSCPLATQQDYSLGDGAIVNILECSEELAASLSTQRTVFLLPYDASQGVETILPSLLQRLISILTKVENAVVTLVCLTSGDEKQYLPANELLMSVKNKLSTTKAALNKQEENFANKLLSTSKDPIEFTAQNTLGLLYRLQAGIDTVYFTNVVTLKDGQTTGDLKSRLAEAVTHIDRLQPIYKVMPSQFVKMTSSLPATNGLHSEASVVNNLRVKNAAAMGEEYKPYQKALKILHAVGKMIYFDDLEAPLVVTDIKWFAQQLKSSCEVNSARISTSEEIVILLKSCGLVCKTRDEATGELKLSWTSKLPVSYPSLPMEYFLEMSQSNKVLTLRFEYKFSHPLSKSLLLNIVSAIGNITGRHDELYPPLIWQSGLVIISGPITVVFNCPDRGAAEPSMMLVAQVIKPTNEKDDTAMRKCLWNVLEFYRVPIEFVIYRAGIYCTRDELFIVDLAKGSESKTDISTKPSFVVGVTYGHSFNSTGPEGETIPANICTHCQFDEDSLRRLWRWRKSLVPTFQTGSLATSTIGAIDCKGSWIQTNAGEKWDSNFQDVLIQLPSMSLCDFNEFNVTFLSGAKCLTLRIKTGQSMPLTRYEFDLQSLLVRAETQTAAPSKKTTALAKGPPIQEFVAGEIITVRLVPHQLTPEEGKTDAPAVGNRMDVLFMRNGETMHKEVIDKDVKLVPYLISFKEQITFLIDTSIVTKQSSQSWEVGMRVEALDRKTPNLIAVATVESINADNGQLLIHFDGWSAHYDYYCEPTSPDIHPIGWMAQRAIAHPEYNSMLQPPRAYEKVFDWEEYLTDIVAAPAPFEIFTSAQTEGCTPLRFKPETVQFLLSQGKGVASQELCVGVRERPLTYVTTALQRWLMGKSLHFETPVAVFLPSDLTRQKLVWPTNKMAMAGAADLSWYFLCTGQSDYWHMVDLPGVPVKTDLNLTMYYQAISSIMASTAVNIKDKVKFAIKDIDTMEIKKVKDRLEILFTMFVWNLCLIRTEDPNDGTDPEVIKANHKQLLADIWTENKEQEALKTNFVIDSVVSKAEGSQASSTTLVPMCKAHHACYATGKGLKKLKLELFEDHHHLMSVVDFSSNLLESLPDAFFSSFPVVQTMNLSKNRLASLPPGIGACRNLVNLNVSHNHLSKLPDDFQDVVTGPLKVLNISSNPLYALPSAALSATLEELDAASIGAKEIPADIGKMTSVITLKLGQNELDSLPPSFGDLTQLIHLDLSGIKWIDTHHDSKMLLSRDSFNEFANHHHSPHFKGIQTKELFTSIDTKGSGALDFQAIQLLNVELYKMFPRFGKNVTTANELLNSEEIKGGMMDQYSGLEQVFKLTNLRSLNLSFQGISRLPEFIKELTNLEELILINNPTLEALPAEIALLKNLKEMPLRGCLSLKTPPKEIVRRGFTAILGYLSRLMMGAVECKRTKLMLVGLGGAGKTSLVDSLTKGATVESASFGAKITDGIDITSWSVGHDGQSLTFGVWDFAGQTVYYNTHQFFMSNRAVYLLLWNIRLGYEHAGLDFWLSSIACHAPKAPILVVGSHKDQVQKFWFPEAIMRKRYPQIRGFYAISSYTGEGVSELRHDLGQIALQEKYMGEKVPEVWLNFERSMLKERFNSSTLTWEKVEGCALDSGIVEKTEVAQAVQFLHDLGSVQHFQNEFLRSRVVISPQWIVDAMSCMVSVQNTPIKEGRLYHRDLGIIWAKYPEELRNWLLRLTEEFDLTFPAKDEEANIVPCLLPAQEPDYSWPDLAPGVKELKMIYRFNYLPAGLFNRVQVRLYQFSDSSTIWKSGSFLHKNGHIALLTTDEPVDVIVKVQGPRPENILFVVHEVFEALISESFHGVQYDYFVPCSDCTKAGTFDPSMFAASRIRRATELKAPFLQCDMYFHTLSLPELHSMMPPDNSSDFDAHLERNLQDLNNLRQEMSFDVFIVYCPENIPQPGEEEKKISPRRILNDLQLSGFRCWFSADPLSISIEQVAVTMREAKVVLLCLSGDFADDERCIKLFNLCKSMQKPMQIIMVGNGLKFLQTSDIGIQVSTEVYVNMTDQAVHRYPSKIVELTTAIRSKVSALMPAVVTPKVFISYCWANSRTAIEGGTKEQPGSLGWGDPRKIKDFLEEKGIHCWLDVEKVSQGQLFEEIADGLRHSKVVIVCASDEYAKSRNCLLEFRFACITLNLPLILAVVGTGFKWENTEVGMLSLGSPKISFQFDNPDAHSSLFAALQQFVTDEDIEKDRLATSASPTAGPDNNQLAFQELLELAERKFLRQVSLYAESMESTPYPRLFLIDVLSEEEVKLVKATVATEEFKTVENAKPVINKEEEEKKRTAAAGQSESAEKTAKQSESGDKNQDAGTKPSATSTNDSARPPSASRTLSTAPTSSRPPSASGEGRSNVRSTAPLPPILQTTAEQTVTAKSGAAENSVNDLAFCVRNLCEHEEGWHPSSSFTFLPSEDPAAWNETITEIAAYMSRLIALLRHTTLSLDILTSTDTRVEQLRKSLDEKCGTDPDFRKQYLYLRRAVMSAADRHDVPGDLERCRLLNGKVVWLCSEHRKQERITILSDDSADASTMANDGSAEAQIMSEALSSTKSTQDDHVHPTPAPHAAASDSTAQKSSGQAATSTPAAASSPVPASRASVTSGSAVATAATSAPDSTVEAPSSDADLMAELGGPMASTAPPQMELRKKQKTPVPASSDADLMAELGGPMAAAAPPPVKLQRKQKTPVPTATDADLLAELGGPMASATPPPMELRNKQKTPVPAATDADLLAELGGPMASAAPPPMELHKKQKKSTTEPSDAEIFGVTGPVAPASQSAKSTSNKSKTPASKPVETNAVGDEALMFGLGGPIAAAAPPLASLKASREEPVPPPRPLPRRPSKVRENGENSSPATAPRPPSVPKPNSASQLPKAVSGSTTSVSNGQRKVGYRVNEAATIENSSNNNNNNEYTVNPMGARNLDAAAKAQLNAAEIAAKIAAGDYAYDSKACNMM